jgi:glycosyltransferase involved in cell wall biosynthesis
MLPPSTTGSRSSVKICAIIPAFNEEDNIAETLSDLHRCHPEITAVVIDDSSTDKTNTTARLPGVVVLSLATNLGIGGAVQTGLRYARSERFDIAVQVDGDGQHMAVEIDLIVEPILSGQAEVVCGSRFVALSPFPIGMIRRLGIYLLRSQMLLLTGRRFSDPTSGFRAYGRSAIEFLSCNYPQDYPEPESIVELLRNGFRVQEVPVRMKTRRGGQSSIGRLDSAYYMVKVMVAIFVAASRRRIATRRKEKP